MGSTSVLSAGLRLDAAARICVAIGLGVAVEGLLYAAPVGWLYAVILSALVLATVVFGKGAAVRSPAILVAVAGIIAVAISPHWASFLLAFLGVVSVALAKQASVTRDAWQWVRSVALFALMMPGVLVLSLFGGSTKMAIPNLPGSLVTSLKQWALPLLLASEFLVLFLIGNPLMADGAASVFNLLIGGAGFSLFDLTASALRVAVIALLCWPLLSVPDLEIAKAEPHLARESMSLGSVLRTLILCNLLFGLQNFFDLTVLWGGGALPADMTLSEYAHQGTYPLALAAVLVGAFVLLAMPAGGAVEQDRGARWLTFLWLAQTGVLTASCLKRMDLYVSAYLLTYLRVFAVIVTVLIGIGLIWIFLRVAWRRSNGWLMTVSTLTGLALLALGSAVDIGARIAWYNVEHSRDLGGEGVFLDVAYLRRAVGPSAIPALGWYIDQRKAEPTAMRWTRKTERAEKAHAALTRDFAETMKDPRAWTLRRYWLRQRIARLE